MTELNQNLANMTNQTTSVAEKRANRRVAIPLKIRYMLTDKTEHVGTILNISVGGALVKAESPPQRDETLIVYIDELGRFEATVIRTEKNLFAIVFEQKRRRKYKIADTLTWLLNGGSKLLNRRTARRVKQNKPAMAIFGSGKKLACTILDISTTGASLKISPRPHIGQIFRVGKVLVKVVRHHEDGVGVEFMNKSINKDSNNAFNR
ncbi:MAG: PilZ domain-containing protein [bacterium]